MRQSSNNPLLISSFIKYNPIVHAIERATYYNNGYKKTFYFKYNEKGNLIENFTDEDKKNYNYEYDANGNWVKKTRLVSLDNNQIIIVVSNDDNDNVITINNPYHNKYVGILYVFPSSSIPT